ncbi:hypothetical protein N0V84_007835 [Fusarium piperis]|uniref:Uncharacterized protein n=1 Tax=Fusarium piperis TaxID=1435070 RepID=A0A9W8W9D4_9HYPO|nr:hypothetical protein N0V84_007835 [Fusarium piperis]
MPAVSILQSFRTALPLKRADDIVVIEPKAHISSHWTRVSEAPKLGLQLRNFFAPLSNSLLGEHLSDSYLAAWEETRTLRNEADVSDAATPQLINPVDLALAAEHPKEIFLLNQDIIQEEMTIKARVDKSWHRRLPGGGDVRFALLDYKRPGVIRHKEFAKACCNPNNFRLARLDGDDTEFEDNAEILLKQAVNYSHQYKTEYVAFFDWDTLLLIYLGDVENFDGGKWCHIELVTDRRQMRRALLGFLEAAYRSSRGGGPRYPHPEIPSAQSSRRSDRAR